MKDFLSKLDLKTLTDRDQEKWHPKAARDWKIVFFAAFAVSFLVLAAHSFLYAYVSSHDVLFETVSSQAPTAEVNIKDMKNILNTLAERKQRTDMILNSPVQMKDPSGAAVAVQKPAPLSASSGAGSFKGIVPVLK